MDGLNPLDVLSRWIHVGTAIAVLGGSTFLRFVLLPAAKNALSDEQHEALRQQVLSRWKRFVHVGIALFLLSGFYNYLIVALPHHRGDGLYHALMGTKILLSFVVFFLASALVGRSNAFARLRANAGKWLLVVILLSAVVVAIGGLLKVRGAAGSEGNRASGTGSYRDARL